jgi:hypothetical protein
MSTSFHTFAFATAFGLSAWGATCVAHGQEDSLEQLKVKNRNLQKALIESNKAESKSTEQLRQINERIEALGKNLLDGGDDRLVQAASDLEIANERISQLESAAAQLTTSIQSYLLQAIVSDPEARIRVETAMRELDSLSGLRQKPLPDVRTGNLHQARIVSLDQESELLVFNLGETQGAQIGMTFRLMRGQQVYGKAILADVRQGISGAFIEQIESKDFTPRLGDSAVLLTQN